MLFLPYLGRYPPAGVYDRKKKRERDSAFIHSQLFPPFLLHPALLPHLTLAVCQTRRLAIALLEKDITLPTNRIHIDHLQLLVTSFIGKSRMQYVSDEKHPQEFPCTSSLMMMKRKVKPCEVRDAQQ